MIHANSLTRKVVEFIKVHPGSTRNDIWRAMPMDTKDNSVGSTLTRLHHANVIENRDGRWYPVEMPVQEDYYVVAVELLDELKEIHHTQREEYLGKRLEEIFSR